MSTETPAPAAPAKRPAPQQNPNVPKLVLPPTQLQRKQTRQEKLAGRKPRGYALLDIGDFAARFGLYQREMRHGLSRRKEREQKESREAARFLRPFFPQAGTKIARADATPADKDRGRIYLTLENGQVINPSKLMRKSDNPVLRQKVLEFIAKVEEAKP